MKDFFYKIKVDIVSISAIGGSEGELLIDWIKFLQRIKLNFDRFFYMKKEEFEELLVKVPCLKKKNIVVKTETPDPFKIVHIKENLETQLNRHVDIVRLRDNMNTFLIERIKKEAIYV